MLATACSRGDAKSEADPNQLFATGFENLEGWVIPNPSLTREKAHSGLYSVKTDPNIEYSLTYNNELGRLSPQRLNKFRLTAWVFNDKAEPAQLVLQITRSAEDNSNVLYEKIDLSQAVKAGEWTEVSKEITLPAEAAANNPIKIYLWRSGSTLPTYLDDLALTVVP